MAEGFSPKNQLSQRTTLALQEATSISRRGLRLCFQRTNTSEIERLMSAADVLGEEL